MLRRWRPQMLESQLGREPTWRLSQLESCLCVAIHAMLWERSSLSRATYRKMVQNLLWATAYSLVAIPVAGGLFVRWGLDLPMSVGAVAMSLSTIIVAANAQLLRRLKLQRAVP